MNPLVGKQIVRVFLADDKEAIRFDLDGGEIIIARADGDCCSHSWIENVENADNLIGTVHTAENIKLGKAGESKGDYGEEYIQFYGFQIVTNKGYCLIDYRNSSNGYYGGSLVWPGDSFYGGVFGQNISKENWKQIA